MKQLRQIYSLLLKYEAKTTGASEYSKNAYVLHFWRDCGDAYHVTEMVLNNEGCEFGILPEMKYPKG